jgi:hypothetical protein
MLLGGFRAGFLHLGLDPSLEPSFDLLRDVRIGDWVGVPSGQALVRHLIFIHWALITQICV